MATTQKANTLAEIRQLAQIYGAKCSVWFFPKDPRTKLISETPILKSVNAKVAYSHIVKTVDERPLFFKMVKTQDQLNGNGIFTESKPKIDQNTLSDPALIELAASNPDFMKAVKAAIKAQKESETTETNDTNPLETA